MGITINSAFSNYAKIKQVFFSISPSLAYIIILFWYHCNAFILSITNGPKHYFIKFNLNELNSHQSGLIYFH